MALATTALSQLCRGIRTFIDGRLNAADRSRVNVVIGTPADAAGAGGVGDAAHRLNLFFFRFEPSGLYPDKLPGETDWLRGFCLITPFATDEDNVSAGENDLRLVGEVLRTFHEQPVLLLNVDGDDYQLQVMMQPLGLDQLNQLWSTQGDTIYRPSALFEISLLPVVPATSAIPAPLVGGLGLQVQPSTSADGTAPSGEPPLVRRLVPDIAREDWAPAITFVVANQCAFSLTFVLGSAELTAFVPQVWVAGKGGERVTLRWESWEATSGWQVVAEDPPTIATILSVAIDPKTAADAPTRVSALPFNNRRGQLLLYAERSYRRAADGAQLTVRSNPLLVSLHEG